MPEETADDILDADGAASELFAFAEGEGERFPTGYSIDTTCGKIGPGELGLVWARSSAGKSTWLLNVLARSGSVPTVVFNMEMTARAQLAWLTGMTRDLPVPARDIEAVLGYPDDSRYPALREAFGNIKRYFPHLHFVHPNEPPTVLRMVNACDVIEERTGVKPLRVFIDHLTLMANARDYEGVSRTTAMLHTWALNENVAVVSIQQTGRGSGDGKTRNDGHIPVTLSSGVYAGEHDADWIWGLYRPEKNPKFADPITRMGAEYGSVKGITRLQLIKNRPFGELEEVGIVLKYDADSRRLYEEGETYVPAMEVDTETF